MIMRDARVAFRTYCISPFLLEAEVVSPVSPCCVAAILSQPPVTMFALDTRHETSIPGFAICELDFNVRPQYQSVTKGT